MQIECGKCEVEDKGQHKKLKERGWRIFFLGNSIKIARCKKCRPVFPEFYHEVGSQMNRIKILNNLKTREELDKEIMNRLIKRIRKRRCHYIRNKK